MTPLTNKRIGVLMGGASSEREISLKSGGAIERALKQRGYQAVSIDVDSQVDRTLRNEEIQIAFLALHGSGGEDGSIQGLLETMRIPYTGSGVLPSAVGMNKGTTKMVLMSCHIRTPQGFYVPQGEQTTFGSLPPGFHYPVVVKPLGQGSTIGVSIVKGPSDMEAALASAFRFGSQVLVEHFIEGKEVTVGILGETPLPVIEMRTKEALYHYEAKYQSGKTEYILPAPLEESEYREVQKIALAVHRAVGCEGVSRVDFRIDGKGVPFVLEINTIPGMTETSLLPKAAAHAGIGYETLVEQILESALEREKTWE
ncbi:MAG TPA: D-alanine--D-alanine ligase [Nitrospiria bacterium]